MDVKHGKGPFTISNNFKEDIFSILSVLFCWLGLITLLKNILK